MPCVEAWISHIPHKWCSESSAIQIFLNSTQLSNHGSGFVGNQKPLWWALECWNFLCDLFVCKCVYWFESVLLRLAFTWHQVYAHYWGYLIGMWLLGHRHSEILVPGDVWGFPTLCPLCAGALSYSCSLRGQRRLYLPNRASWIDCAGV